MGDSGNSFREEKLSPLAPCIHAVQKYECTLSPTLKIHFSMLKICLTFFKEVWDDSH